MTERERSLVEVKFLEFEKPASKDELECKQLIFGELHAGNCAIYQGGTLTFCRNGHFNWSCSISSSDSGDEARCIFSYLDAGGGALFEQAYDFDIRDENQIKRWIGEIDDPSKTPYFDVCAGVALRWYC